VGELAFHFCHEKKAKKRYDVFRDGAKWETVDMERMKNSDTWEVGAEWLCRQAFDQLGIAHFLDERGWSQGQISLVSTHIISRAIYPASELKTTLYIKKKSAICEITGYEREKVSKDGLYGISHKLYLVKDQLDQYLSRQTNELFDLEDKIILYDLINTYFEG
jgi:hypothetical protein